MRGAGPFEAPSKLVKIILWNFRLSEEKKQASAGKPESVAQPTPAAGGSKTAMNPAMIEFNST